jgi:hypothetical protein
MNSTQKIFLLTILALTGSIMNASSFIPSSDSFETGRPAIYDESFMPSVKSIEQIKGFGWTYRSVTKALEENEIQFARKEVHPALEAAVKNSIVQTWINNRKNRE